ncbi:hypothetical protein A2897_02840 [Candidatus Woesebacteria bacterium RIFCSPLOWO2_01_FULL_44_24b]|nr:MAG: hypothetical protein A2897_02840 [Candidatus Woesebacteria bacterium RIFCSPLOWO2_01_FULL_44_24b]
MRRRRAYKPVSWEKAEDVKKELTNLVKSVDLNWIDLDKVYCVRSTYSTARAYARIWGMGRIWQETLGIPASYCIEVISEKFDPLPKHKQVEVLFHELAHIPKNFSGALLPHTRHHKGSFHDKLRSFLAAYKQK